MKVTQVFGAALLITAPLTAASPNTGDLEMEPSKSSVSGKESTVAAAPPVKVDAPTVQPTFGKEITEDTGLAGNLFGGFKNTDTTTGDDGQKLDAAQDATTTATDLTPTALGQPMDRAQLEALTVAQLRDLMGKMKISYRLIDSKEVLIQKILSYRN